MNSNSLTKFGKKSCPQAFQKSFLEEGSVTTQESLLNGCSTNMGMCIEEESETFDMNSIMNT